MLEGHIHFQEIIPEDVKVTVPTGGVPVYLEDRTVIGRGTVSADGRTITLEIDGQYPVAELMQENLVGLSIVNMAADRTEDILNKQKEKTDD